MISWEPLRAAVALPSNSGKQMLQALCRSSGDDCNHQKGKPSSSHCADPGMILKLDLSHNLVATNVAGTDASSVIMMTTDF